MAEQAVLTVSTEHNRSKAGLYPLAEACQQGNEAQVRRLLDRGASPHARDEDGYSSYHYVAISNNKTILHHLLASSSGHNVNVPTNYDETPLHLACLNGHLQSAELLCKNGADLKAVDVKGNTVLHFAAASGCVELVNWIAHTEEGKQLIQRANKDGDTPAHCAARLGCRETYTTLIHLGSNPTLINRWGRTPHQELNEYSFSRGRINSTTSEVTRGELHQRHKLHQVETRDFRCNSEPKLSRRSRRESEREEEVVDVGTSGRHSSADIHSRSPSPTTSITPQSHGVARFQRKPSPLSVVTHQQPSGKTSLEHTTGPARRTTERNPQGTGSKSTPHIQGECHGNIHSAHPGSHSETNIIPVAPVVESPASCTPRSEHRSMATRELYCVTPNQDRVREPNRTRTTKCQSEKLSRKRVMSAGGGVNPRPRNTTPDLGARARTKSDGQPRQETYI